MEQKWWSRHEERYGTTNQNVSRATGAYSLPLEPAMNPYKEQDGSGSAALTTGMGYSAGGTQPG